MKFKSTIWLLPILAVTACGQTPISSSEAPSSTSPASSEAPSSALPSSALPSSEVPSSEAPSSELPSSSEPSKRAIVVEEREIQYSDDFYRNFYQIFPYSFADSNGDGVGDLNGIIDKFDYIKDLNMTGIWLNPVSKSPTYHKYDVMDYKSIDNQFGSLADYDTLVNLCHQNHMAIIFDLVVNHSSDQHPWFTNCMNAHRYGDTSNKYYNYYNVQDFAEDGFKEWNGTGLYYECRFDRTMPDLNLQGVIDGTNTNLINDLRDIMRFWLVDHGVDGFRLDACTSFFTGNMQKNIEFINWLKAECNAIKPHNYIIGEVLEQSSIYSKYFESDADSYFAFDDSPLGGRNRIFNAVQKAKVKYIETYIDNDIIHAKGHIPAPVISNHDNGVGRATKTNHNQNRMHLALLSIANGATFSYYADEIGAMTVKYGDDYADQGFRLPLQWGDSYTCRPIRAFDFDAGFPEGTVADQDNDSNSVLNYVRKIFRYRLENPELARGTCDVLVGEDEACGILKREYNGSVVYIAVNLSSKKDATLDISDLNVKVVGDLSVGETPYFEGDQLVMPTMSMLLLH